MHYIIRQIRFQLFLKNLFEFNIIILLFSIATNKLLLTY